MRSVLVVPVGDPALLDHAFTAGADAVVLDLASGGRDPASRNAARDSARATLRFGQIAAHRPHLYVRLGDLDDGAFDDALAAVMIGEPDGILLAGCRSGMDVQHLAAKLAVQEAECGLADGESSIIAEIATARALFRLDSYADCSSRLIGLTLNAERLAVELGSESHADGPDQFSPLSTARHMLLFAARAAEVAAIDAATDAHDGDALRASCEAARRVGFNAKLTAHPDQAAIINAVFGLE